MTHALNHLRLLAIASTLILSACGGAGGSSSETQQQVPRTAHLTVSTTGSGSVTSTPAAINCGTQCDAVFPAGTTVQLSAAAASGYQFVGWSGSGVSSCATAATCSVTVDQSQAVTATFSLVSAPQYTLDVTLAGSGTVTSDVSGVNCPTDCSGTYASGTVVTLTATAASGYTFTGWSGSGVACPGTVTCALTMSSARAATATFTQNAPATYALTTSVSGSGTISSNPSGINCGTTCNAIYNSGTSVTLTATPASGFTFTGWTGACTGTNGCTVAMTAARQVQAAFTATPPNTAALNTVVVGSGTVTSAPAGINCPTDCAETVNVGAVVTLTATPTTGNSFVGWSVTGCTAATCTVTMNSATTVTATFAPITYTLGVTKQGGSGTVTSTTPAGTIACGATCSATYNTGTSVTLAATPATGYSFSNWTGACTGSGSCVLTMNAAKSVTAVFAALPTYSLTVQKSGAGTGTVTSSPSGISCGATCTANYNAGSSVQLTAAPAAGSTFSSWGGACSGSGTCTVSMSAAQTVTATFAVSTSSGKSYYVSNSGSDTANGTSLSTPFKTITKAVTVATAGDIIELRAGTYNEAVVIRTAGTSSAWITLRGYNGEWPVIRRPTGAGPTVYFYNDACDETTIGTGTGNTDCLASYWVLQGLVIQGSQGGGSDGNVVKIDTAKVRLDGNKLCCSEADIVKLVRTANDVEVVNNEIWQDAAITTPSSNAQGVDIVGADRSRVANNYVHDVPDFAMYAKGNARNTIFENNRIVNVGNSNNGHAMMIGQETDVERLVDGVYEAYDAIVRNNVVINAAWACVATASSSNVRIYNNSCYNTGTTGHGSIFLSNESLLGTKGVNIEVVNNIIYGSANRPLIKVNSDALSDYSTFRVSNNIYYVTGGAPTFQPNADNSAVNFSQWLTQYKTLSGNTDNSQVIDPKYASTSPTSSPLTLSAGSPAINAGKATTLVTTDFLGVARPQGGTIDIGAYEY